MQSSVSTASKISTRKRTIIGRAAFTQEPTETTCGGAVEKEISTHQDA